MFDKRLLRELKNIPAFMIKVAAAAFVAVTLTIIHNGLLAYFINELVINEVDLVSLKLIIIFVVFVILLKAIVSFIRDQYHHNCGIRIKRLKRRELMEVLFKLGPIELKKESSGALSEVFIQAIEDLEPFYAEFLPQMVTVGVGTVLVLLTVAFADITSALIMLVTLPFIPVFMILIGKLTSEVSSKQWQKLQQLNGHFLDVLRGLNTLRSFNKLEEQRKKIETVNEAFRIRTMSVLRIAFLSALVLELVATLSTAVVAVSLGVRLIYGNIDFYGAFFVLLMAPVYYQPIRILGSKFHSVMGANAAAETLYDLTDKYYKESKSCELQSIEEQVETIRFENITYAYVEGEEVLNNISLNFVKGETLALIGPSGSGKSTLIAILLGFIKSYSGNIYLNEKSQKGIIDQEWKGLFAYVPQSPSLFKGTLWENIIMNNPDATLEEVNTCIKKVGLSQWVEELVDGYETVIGERGIDLSGGQKQRLVIARALLKNAPILILDEPTSALDPKTEQDISRLIKEDLQDMTILIIAHRIPTILQADRVAFLNNGSIDVYREEVDYEFIQSLFDFN